MSPTGATSPSSPSALSPVSAPGKLEQKGRDKLRNSNGSLGSNTSLGSEPRSTASWASCPDLRRPTSRQQVLARLRPTPTNPRQLVPSGENVNGSASLVNWREYVDDKRKYPYRGIRGGFAPPSWFSVALALGLITMPGTEISRLPMAVCALVTVVLKAQVSGMALTVGWGGKALGRIWRGGQGKARLMSVLPATVWSHGVPTLAHQAAAHHPVPSHPMASPRLTGGVHPLVAPPVAQLAPFAPPAAAGALRASEGVAGGSGNFPSSRPAAVASPNSFRPAALPGGAAEPGSFARPTWTSQQAGLLHSPPSCSTARTVSR
eukprot:g19654.t1